MENDAFRRFTDALGYRLPTRQAITSRLVPQLYEAVNQCVEEIVCRAQFVALSADGWSDNRSRSVINFMVHIPGYKPLLYRTVDTKYRSHTGKLLIFDIKHFSSLHCGNYVGSY